MPIPSGPRRGHTKPRLKAPGRTCREVLDYLVDYISTTGVNPTYRQIMSAVGVSSTSTVAKHIETLIRLGYCARPQKNSHRLILTGFKLCRDDSDELLALQERIFRRTMGFDYQPDPKAFQSLSQEHAIELLGSREVFVAAMCRVGEQHERGIERMFPGIHDLIARTNIGRLDAPGGAE